MREDGFFWYSETQKELKRQLIVGPDTFCCINGKIQEYTQWFSGKHLRKESNFKDAVCLGYGFVVGSEREKRNHWANKKGEN